MTDDQAPIRGELRAPFDAAALDRVWSRVSRARAAPSAPKLPWVLAFAAAGIAAIATIGLTTRPRAVEPLLMSSGEPILRELPSGEHELSDGSRIRVAPETLFVRLTNAPHEIVFLLELGRVDVSIVPGGERRFSFECGLADVEVIGTRFTIERTNDRVIVEVEEGTVLVRSRHLAEGARRISRGDRLVIEAAREVVLPVPSPSPPPLKPPKISKSTPPALDLPPPQPDADALLALADEARRSGQHGRAADLLRRIIDEHPSDPRSALAAFSLGKLELDVNAHPKEAAAAFEHALAIGLPSALVEDAYARLLDAQLAAGQRAAAARTAQLYLSRFPNGRHRDRAVSISP